MYGRFGQGNNFGLEGKKLTGASAHFAKMVEEKKQELAKKIQSKPKEKK